MGYKQHNNSDLVAVTFPLLTLCTGFLVPSDHAQADVFQVNASVSSGHYLRGIELANDGTAVALSFDWSSDVGVFSGLECYFSDADDFTGFERGCIAYLGYFAPINSNQAISIEGKRYDYTDTRPIDWDTNELAVSWHYKDAFLVSLSYSDDWLARDTDTLALDFNYNYSLTDRIFLSAEVGFLEALDETSFDSVLTLGAGIEYQANRWSLSLKTNTIDSQARNDLPFEFSQPELIWTFNYQIY